MATNKKIDSSVTYERAIDELDLILDKMDRGEIPLNESMDDFERGIQLINHCEKILNTYERKISKIITDKNGELKDVEIDD